MKTENKPKIGFYWCASCGGCEEAILDLAEDLLIVADKADIVFWPVAMDFKLSDVKAMEDGELLAVFINGAIQLSEQEEVARLLRRKSQLIVAFGACAHMGGLPGLANMWSASRIKEHYYTKCKTVINEERVIPDQAVTARDHQFPLPELYDSVRSLDQVIDVDYYIPGCAPTPNVVRNALTALLSGKLPEKGSVLASTRALCYECALNETKPDEGMSISRFRRYQDPATIDPNTCLLTQGLVCLGPVTRGGCGSMCIKGQMPCTGCFGPMDGVRDFGASALAYIASLIEAKEPEEIEKILDEAIPDPVGTFYMYSLPRSMLYRRQIATEAVLEQTEES